MTLCVRLMRESSFLESYSVLNYTLGFSEGVRADFAADCAHSYPGEGTTGETPLKGNPTTILLLE